MTEEEARAWITDNIDVSRETLNLLERFIALTCTANETQNLIARSTYDSFWNRHIVDSAQLLQFVSRETIRWIDLGSGAGLPGLIVAMLSDHVVMLVEERRKRQQHLIAMIDELNLADRVGLLASKVEQVAPCPYDVISARAYAPLDRLFASAHHLSDSSTTWLLPKGKSHASELEAARRTWQGRFEVIPSVTDPEGAIIIATDVQPRRRR